MKPTAFEFNAYTFLPETHQVSFTYTQTFADAQPLTFTEVLVLPKSKKIRTEMPPQLLKNLLESMHLILGLSYYKLYCPTEVKIPYALSADQADFWNTVYRKGLGEFLYRNSLDPKQVALFPVSQHAQPQSYEINATDRVLLGIGGGKDSIVAAELFKEQKIPVTALVTQTNRPSPVTKAVLDVLELPSLKIERLLDKKIFAQHAESYNGHIPVSATFAFIGLFTSVLYDYKYPVVANELSSNFGNVTYKGEVINHQWSKSQEFETLFQNYVRSYITPSVIYFSPLRPFYEFRVVELLSRYPQYFQIFSSCNRMQRIRAPEEFVARQGQGSWCGQCPKCAFVFLLLAAHLPKKTVIKIFNKNLFEDELLLDTFKDLLGFGNLKPFECVGTFDESKAALYKAGKKFKNDLAIKTFLPKIDRGAELVKQVSTTNPAPGIPAQFVFLGMKNALILGYGREGKVTEKYLKKRFPHLKIGIADEKRSKNYLKLQDQFDIAIKTPSLPRKLVTIPYTTATNIFFANVKNPIVGVTGSKGKSTTATLIAAILKRAGKRVEFLGNIGGPMLSALLKPIHPKTIFVLELSSYQLEDLRQSPQLAVVTSLFPEHMDYHGSQEMYFKAKQNIAIYQNKSNYFVYNPAVDDLKTWAQSAKSIAVPFHEDIPVKDQDLPLLGAHNKCNIRAAVTVARLMNIPDTIISDAIKHFKSLPHRLQNIGTYQKITFYDDAISTSPESTIEAIKSLPKIGTIFLGGQDRGYTFTELEHAIRSAGIKNIVLFPDTGNRMFKQRKGLNVLKTRTIEAAVRFAFEHTKPGEIVLLSTASPSYSLWKDFIEKGTEFQKYVKKLGDKGANRALVQAPQGVLKIFGLVSY